MDIIKHGIHIGWLFIDHAIDSFIIKNKLKSGIRVA